MRIAILDDYVNASAAATDWSALESSHEIVVFRQAFVTRDDVVAMLRNFEIVVAMRERTPFPAPLLEDLPNLRLLITTGMRNAAIDLEAASANGIVVCGTRAHSASTAELTIGLMIALMRDIPNQFQSMRQGGWQTCAGRDLAGKSLGLLGLGKLGGAVAATGRALGMDLLAWSQNLSLERATEVGARLVGKDDLFRQSDVLTIHLVLSPRTTSIVGSRELKLMKPSAYLINTSRGPIVDEHALIDVLRAGGIAGAAIDVYDIEPLADRHPLRRLDNVLLTPHLGYVTQENLQLMYRDAVEDIVAYLRGAPIRILNPENLTA